MACYPAWNLPGFDESEKIHRTKRQTDAGVFILITEGLFVGAAEWMTAVEKDEKTKSFLGEQQNVWQFTLSRGPWWGGQFERIIDLIEAALNKTIGNGYLKWRSLKKYR